jgi:hypothetical protein
MLPFKFSSVIPSTHRVNEPTVSERTEALPPIEPDNSTIPIRLVSRKKTTTYTSAAFKKGLVPKDQVIEEYRKKSVEYRGTKIAHNVDEFNQCVKLPKSEELAPTDDYESMISTLGPALDALTEGKHPKIDWSQPVLIPADHPKIKFISLIQAQHSLGFRQERRDFNNDIASTTDNVTTSSSSSTSSHWFSQLANNTNKFAREIYGAADEFFQQMYNINDSDKGENKS